MMKSKSLKHLWVNSTDTIALMTKSQTKKLFKNHKVEPVMVETAMVLRNESQIVINSRYGFLLDIFKEAKKIAQSLNISTSAFFISNQAEAFPAYFSGENIDVVFAPKIIESQYDEKEMLKIIKMMK